MPDAVSPETGAAPDRPRTRTELISGLGSLMGAQTGEPEQAEAETTEVSRQEADPETDGDAEPQAAAEESEEESEEESVEPSGDVEEEAEDPDDTPELPETVEDFAEALGVDLQDLLSTKGKVKVNGQELEVSLADALQGYQRESDYNREMERLSAERQKDQAERQEAITLIQSRAQQVDEMAQALQALDQAGPTDEELARLSQDDPFAYAEAMEQKRRRDAALQQYWSQRQQWSQQQAQDRDRQLAEHRQQQQELLKGKLPELRSEEGQRKFESRITDALTKHYGFTDNDVKEYFNGAWDHRYVRILDDAAKFRQMETGKKDLGKRLAKKARPNKPRKSGPSKGKRQELRDRLRNAPARSIQERNAAVANLRNQLFES